ncbi:MAG: hypothetical protein AMXMBFR23_02550 [Chloroflexota bacterium]
MATRKKTADPVQSGMAMIALDRLKPSPHNARKTPHTEAALEALAASIHHKGLLQNLIVQPECDADGAETGYYLVTAGEGRRLALLLRVKRGQISGDEPIRCVVDATGDPLEVSLDENVTRSPMNAADQFEAFKRLADEQGLGAEEIGARFGVSAHVVRQRMRLGAVSPLLMQLYREGEVTLEQLMAFAISEDHARQEHVYRVVQEGWNRQPAQIRRLMIESHVEPDDPRALFAGEAYAQAGGAVVRDLFSEEDGGYLADVELLDRLVVERLNAIAAEVQAEGWKWVEARLEFPYDHGMRRFYPQHVELSASDQERLDAIRGELEALEERYDAGEELTGTEEARYDELEAEIEQLLERQRAYDPVQMARSGAFVSLSRDGQARIERGFIRTADEPAWEAAPDAGSEPTGVETSGEEDEHVPSADESTSKPLPDALVRDLTAHRTLALRLELGQRPDVALVAATHALAAQLFFHDAPASCLELQVSEVPLRQEAPGIDESSSGRALAERHEAWAARLPEDAGELWTFIAGLDHAERMPLFAHCLSLSVFAVRQRWERKAGAQANADILTQALSLDMVAHWQPTAEGYFSRVTKALILEAVREAADEEASRIAGMKKQAMAEAAEEVLTGKGWLPHLLRSSDGAEGSQVRPEAA